MKKLIFVSAIALAAFGNTAFAGNSTFQQTCSNISFAYAGSAPEVRATCLRRNGEPHNTATVIHGISNQNGKLTMGGGASSFQKSCGNIQIQVTTSGASLTAFCRTASGASNQTSIALNGINNNNGNLTHNTR